MTEKTVVDCKQCGGTGWLWLNKSWFIADGHRRERCGVCGGTGHSDYQPEAEFAKRQRDLRTLLGNR